MAPPSSSLLCLLSAAMEELDGDEVRVSSRGRFADRDIVQVMHVFIHNLHRLNVYQGDQEMSVLFT